MPNLSEQNQPPASAESRWVSSLREFRSPRAVAFCGVMCALAVVLGQIATINMGPYLKIGLSGMPNQVVDMLFGPSVGAIFSGALEVLKYVLRTDGVYFPGFTLSAMAAGAVGSAELRSGSLPRGSDRTPVRRERQRRSRRRPAERPGGQKRGGAGTPPAGQGRSRSPAATPRG